MVKQFGVIVHNELGIAQLVMSEITQQQAQIDIMSQLTKLVVKEGFPLELAIRIDNEADGGERTSVEIGLIDKEAMAEQAVSNLLSDLDMNSN